MNILLSNDDGAHAPGLAALADGLKGFGDIYVIAPNRDRSGSSNALTLDEPLYPEEQANGFISINGMPSDCVHLAMGGVLVPQPDIVIAGINSGPNLGDDVLYSGTVAAAIEGRHLNLPPIAISLVGEQHYATAVHVARQVLTDINRLKLTPTTVLSVNVPDIPLAELKGIQITRLGYRYFAQQPLPAENPRGKKGYWINAVGSSKDDGEGTDFYAIEQGYASITPLQMDMTSYSNFDALSDWLEKK